MSRSGYTEDIDDEWRYICWRGAVASAFKGKRGQAFLREMLKALDALPYKRLCAGDIVNNDGDCCAIGSVALSRDLDVSDVDPSERGEVGDAFGIAKAMAAEIAYENDEAFWGPETLEERWVRMRAWTAKQIRESP